MVYLHNLNAMFKYHSILTDAYPIGGSPLCVAGYTLSAGTCSATTLNTILSIINFTIPSPPQNTNSTPNITLSITPNVTPNITN